MNYDKKTLITLKSLISRDKYLDKIVNKAKLASQKNQRNTLHLVTGYIHLKRMNLIIYVKMYLGYLA